MPSKQQGEELRGLIKKIRDGTFEYDSKEQVLTNWAQYDQAQIYEMANYLDNIRDLVAEAYKRIKGRTPPRKRGPGRPPTDPADIAKTLLLQTYTQSSNRVAEGLLLLFREKLDISRHFSYKTIERGYGREPVNEILDESVVITNESVEGKEMTFSFDGTGFSASNKDNYADKRQKQNSKKGSKKSKSASKEQADDSFPESNSAAKKGFSYSVMGIGVQYKIISGISISPDHSIGETTMFPEAFNQTLNCHPNLDGVLGDGIYGCRWITNLVSENNSTPHFLPRSNVTFKSKGAMGWYDMLYSLWEDPQEWLEHYHMRSISETVNSMVKCRFGAPLRKRLESRKETETRLKLVGHNIRRVGYLEIMGDVVPHWRRSAGS
jgi:transposase